MRRVAIALAVLGALLVGASRVYLGVHWTTDVLAGWFLGTALAVLCLTLARVLDARARLGDSPDDDLSVHRPDTSHSVE